jgi:hypothetical protein
MKDLLYLKRYHFGIPAKSKDTVGWFSLLAQNLPENVLELLRPGGSILFGRECYMPEVKVSLRRFAETSLPSGSAPAEVWSTLAGKTAPITFPKFPPEFKSNGRD